MKFAKKDVYIDWKDLTFFSTVGILSCIGARVGVYSSFCLLTAIVISVIWLFIFGKNLMNNKLK